MSCPTNLSINFFSFFGGGEGDFFAILTSTYGPGPYGPGPLGPYGPGSLVILKNILNLICSRNIFEKHTAQRAYSEHAPGAVCILNMVLEHIWLRKFFQIINGPEPYGYKSRPQQIQKAFPGCQRDFPLGLENLAKTWV